MWGTNIFPKFNIQYIDIETEFYTNMTKLFKYSTLFNQSLYWEEK